MDENKNEILTAEEVGELERQFQRWTNPTMEKHEVGAMTGFTSAQRVSDEALIEFMRLIKTALPRLLNASERLSGLRERLEGALAKALEDQRQALTETVSLYNNRGTVLRWKIEGLKEALALLDDSTSPSPSPRPQLDADAVLDEIHEFGCLSSGLDKDGVERVRSRDLAYKRANFPRLYEWLESVAPKEIGAPSPSPVVARGSFDAAHLADTERLAEAVKADPLMGPQMAHRVEELKGRVGGEA